MLFKRSSSRAVVENPEENDEQIIESMDDVDTVVGPSVSVEGDFASEGNIIVKGTVTGSVHTSKHLLVDPGAKIVANIRAGRLVFLVDSAALSTRLRLHTPPLLEAARKAGLDATALTVKVATMQPVPPDATPRTPLSPAAG